MYVLRRDLKTGKVVEALTWGGRAFHSVGATTEKDLSPRDFSLDLGTLRSDWSADLRALDGSFGTMSSDM